ncbi:MAG: TIGR04086 family membrane protein [Clostridiales bacterium]|nr:TIGR04086 family membrane protein [Clostridiales bacterium]
MKTSIWGKSKMETMRGHGKTIGRVVGALTVSFLVTVILLLGFAFLLLKLQLTAGQTEIGIMVIYVLSCFTGGLFCGRKADRRKFLWGLLTGVLYFLLLLAISGMGEEALQPQLTRTLLSLALCVLGGTLGGMLAG